MQIRPELIRCIAYSPRGPVAAGSLGEVTGAAMAEYCRAGLAVLMESPFWPPGTWQMETLGLQGEGAPGAALERLAAEPGPLPDSFSLRLELGSAIAITLRTAAIGRAGYFALRITRDVGANDGEADLTAFMRQTHDVARRLAAGVGLGWAVLEPVLGGATSVPYPPLVEGNSHLVAVTEAAVAAAYDDPSAFWDSGWDAIDRFGEVRLLARGMDRVCGPEYLARLVEQHWLLARAAKPGKTRYHDPEPAPSESAVFHSGVSRLEAVGYVATDQLAEYSCVLQPGQFIPGWEIYELRDMVETKQLSDGRPVKTVRIVFLDQRAALQERRPLLDIGCRVFHYTDDGTLRELTE